MMKAIRIIERLLTQTKYHEQHVLYKNYPPVSQGDKNKRALLEEEEENAGKKPLFPAIGKKDKNKVQEEEKKEEDEKDKVDENAVTLKSLFKFECDITDGR